MKVICIDDKMSDGSQQPHLRYGEIYEPSGEGENLIGELCYVLSEFPPTICPNVGVNPLPLYRKSRFIPLSEIDETEFERNYNKELA